MTSCTIDEPFVLASYTSSFRGKSVQRPLYATSYRKTGSNADGYVTVAAQADGVHILDVSTLHPIISHTLGPSASFACPPITLPTSSKNISTTYAILSTSTEFSSPEEGGRTLWMWQDDETLAAKEKQKAKHSKNVLSPQQFAHAIYSCDELADRIILLSTTGEVSVIDAQSLDIKSIHQLSTPSSSRLASVMHAFILPSSSCSFVSAERGAVLAVVSSESSKKTYLKILAIDEADSISEYQTYDIPIERERIASASCSPSGTFSIVTSDGSWHSYQLSPFEAADSSITQPPQLSPSLRLTGFSSLATPNIQSTHNDLSISTIALTSSFVLLAGITTSQEISLLVWDLKFSVVLASHVLPIPSSLSSSSLYLHLVAGPQFLTRKDKQILGQAVLIVSSLPPSSSGKNKDISKECKSTSVLVVIPYLVPMKSTIAGAMGRGGISEKWLRTANQPATPGKPSAEEAARTKVLSTLRSAIQGGRAQAAAAAFMKWVPKGVEGQEKDSVSSLGLTYDFVKEILCIVLLQSDPKTPDTYSPEIVRYLLEKRVVSSAMVEYPGSLLGALRARGDWSSIELAFKAVLDLTEAEIVDTLRAVVANHKPVEDAMDVDVSSSSTSTTTLPMLLGLLTTYPTSRDPLLLALRRQMRDAELLTPVLEILDSWLTRRTRMEHKLLPSKKDLKKTENGIWVVVGRKGGNKKLEEIPPLDKIITLLQIILDASFIALLQYAPAHKTLRSINTQLNPEIAYGSAAEVLRGPLEPFAIAQEKAVRDSLVPQKEKEKERQKGDWRQKRKRIVGEIGVYQLEELVL
ncbi:hypothetical protein B0H34DRAFT_254615 [Crassisporium funariophilum]|nr:hypothetical protein B0H34DRAFT_254615 [Crassisporium funariophilum]